MRLTLLAGLVFSFTPGISSCADSKYRDWKLHAWLSNLRAPLLLNGDRAPARSSTPPQSPEKIMRRRSSRGDAAANSALSLSPQQISKLNG